MKCKSGIKLIYFMSKYAKVDLVTHRSFDSFVKLFINTNLQCDKLKNCS